MSNFDIAVGNLLAREGGFVNDPNDNGGATKYGISLRFFKRLNPAATVDDIKNLTAEEAKQIYKEHFWDVYHLSLINDPAIAEKAFDMLVNMRPKTAILIIQKAINQLRTASVAEDGIIGKMTIQAINQSNADLLLNMIRLNCVRQYVAIVDADKSQRVFFFGWIKNRALL